MSLSCLENQKNNNILKGVNTNYPFKQNELPNGISYELTVIIHKEIIKNLISYD